MSMVQTEKDYQNFIVDYLAKENGYIFHSDYDFHCVYAFDKTLLLFLFKAGCLVHFAMDLNYVTMKGRSACI